MDKKNELIEAINKVRKQVDSVPKSGRNKAQNYKYAELADYLNTIGELIIKEGLVITTSIDTVRHLPPITTKSGGYLYPCAVQGTMTVHKDDQSLSIGVAGYAQNSGDKAVYAAITGARKYGLAQLFNLITTDDPESLPDGDPARVRGILLVAQLVGHPSHVERDLRPGGSHPQRDDLECLQGVGVAALRVAHPGQQGVRRVRSGIGGQRLVRLLPEVIEVP